MRSGTSAFFSFPSLFLSNAINVAAISSGVGGAAGGWRGARELVGRELAVAVDVELLQDRGGGVDLRGRQGIAAVGVEGGEQREAGRSARPTGAAWSTLTRRLLRKQAGRGERQKH